jgi:mannose-1-phosphate guanylyltransferase / mannose-6-phosphate isomerase
MPLVIPVILCGGSGTRLWPLSRSGFPKQFLVLSGDGSSQSLFQQAITRTNSVGNANIALGNALVVTNEEHRFLVLDQLRDLNRESNHFSATLLLEPVGRNTAPALSMAAFCAQQLSGNQDPILVITPADQTIQHPAAFTKALQDCIQIVDSEEKAIAILGITPTAPETGYGYIQRSDTKDQNNAYKVDRYVEKPDSKTAQAYLADGCYLWNSGMFVLKASTWLAALKEFRQDIYAASQKAWETKTEDAADGVSFIRPGKEEFMAIPSESIDYAVIEKCPKSHYKIKMVELNAGWNDLGAWDSVWQVGKQDMAGNVASGDTLLANSKNSLIYASSRLVATSGVENLIVVETADAVLVADRRYSQDVKNIVAQLEQRSRDEKNLHRKVYRPWGWYDSIDEGENFKVKRIQVKPGASLSLQVHHHRAEHWVVVKGIAEVTNGEAVNTLQKNQSTYIPKGQIHRLKNIGTEALEIIEVQSGDYLGEDDIVRLEDGYGRMGH